MIYIKNNALRNTLKYILPFILIPLLVLIGALFINENKHIFISFGVVILALILFITGFEKSKSVREEWLS